MNPQVKKFSIKLTLILLPFLLLFLWIEFKARNLPNSYAVKKQNFEKVQDSIAIMVFGSSHALKGIEPSCFSLPAFNFSNSSQTLIHDAGLCQHYLDHLPQLKAVVFDISYISFFFDIKDSPESWRDYFYYHYFDLKDPSLDILCPSAFFYTALYTRGVINDILFNRLDYKKEFGDIQSDGWEKTEAPADSSVISNMTGLQRVKLHESLRKEKNSIEIMHQFKKVLMELNRRNIHIIFVSLPVYMTYYNHLNPFMERENREIIDALCREFHGTYSDYTRDPRFPKADFFDNDHLNSTGAKKFSRILDKEIVSPAGQK